MTSIRNAAPIAAMLAMSGCGVMFNEKERLVLIESSPPGAEVEVDGRRVGRTPVEVLLPTSRSASVVVERAGQAPQVCQVNARIEPIWVILDIWFLVPLIVDAATGGWNDLPDRCAVVFGRAPTPISREPDEPSPKPAPPGPTKPTTPVKPTPEPTPKPFPFPK